jgi:hypothetical protein
VMGKVATKVMRIARGTALTMVVAVMLVAGVASAAFAHTVPNYGCGYEGIKVHSNPPGASPYDRNADGYYCGYLKHDGTYRYKDNHPHYIAV